MEIVQNESGCASPGDSLMLSTTVTGDSGRYEVRGPLSDTIVLRDLGELDSKGITQTGVLHGDTLHLLFRVPARSQDSVIEFIYLRRA
jgi:hypothetical protein